MTVEKQEISYSPDIKIFLILIPFISAFNYYLTYPNIAFNSFTLIRYAVDTAQGLIAWWIVRSLIIWLDSKIPFLEAPVKRTLIQVVFTTACGLGFIIISTELLSLLVYGEPAIQSFYTLDVLIILIWFFVINGIYIGLLLFKHLQGKVQSKEELEGILVSKGKKKRLIPIDEILVFSIGDGYVELHINSGEKFLLDHSLDYWQDKLSEDVFFRANRKSLISRRAMTGFESKENGKLKIELHKSLPHVELGVSRAKAPSFKRWFRPNF